MNERLGIIRDFVESHINGLAVDDDEDIFATGYVNSLFAVQLVMFVENTFGVTANGDDLDIGNFRTINVIDAFVTSKLAVPAA
ncbi:acyl carrier protein [Micromonospora sp. ANENR4]|uniref:acyl carrier protein n=1 Tax=unclassified Micromonospora TaxID=2617518 RepID=UPI00188E4510|nr:MULTISPECIES: acyl carrier protein [unclassified Micromonospora]MBF5033656.1 acyl carrier protein [Micromonospora sp. ANENR4]MCZ7476270.1 acyl carrier protein [Micromonospora sp. WMMC273]